MLDSVPVCRAGLGRDLWRDHPGHGAWGTAAMDQRTAARRRRADRGRRGARRRSGRPGARSGESAGV